MNELGGFLRDKRQDEKLPLRSMAEAIGLSFAHLGRIERGESELPPERIGKAAEALHLNGSERKQFFVLAGTSMGATLFEPANLPSEYLDAVAKQISKQANP